MNAYATRLWNVAAQLRQLTGLAGSMAHHGALLETLAHEVETMAVVIEAGIANPAPANVVPNSSIARELIVAGRKVLATKYHPDVGGDNERMQELNCAADRLISQL